MLKKSRYEEERLTKKGTIMIGMRSIERNAMNLSERIE